MGVRRQFVFVGGDVGCRLRLLDVASFRCVLHSRASMHEGVISSVVFVASNSRRMFEVCRSQAGLVKLLLDVC